MQVNGFNSKAAAIRHLKAAGFNFSALLSAPESNPKLAKNGKLDVLSAPLHLAPFNLSGFNVCAQASPGCSNACIHYQGNPAYMEQKDKSRKEKTRAYFLERDAFLAVLVFEIAALKRKAESRDMQCAVRLNATSDLPFEKRRVNIDGVEYGLMDYFADVQFYDYTKITKRAIAWAQGDMPNNYHITFSRTESNDSDVARVLESGGNVAIVFSAPMAKELIAKGSAPWHIPAFGHTARVAVTDGDSHDYRPADPRGCIVALKAKGDARKDTSGFVIR